MTRKKFIKQIMGNYLLDRNTAASMAKTSRQRGASYADSLRLCYEIYCYFCRESMVTPLYGPMYGSVMEHRKHLAITGLDENIPSVDPYAFKPIYRLDTKPLEVKPVIMHLKLNPYIPGGGGYE